MLCRVSLSSLSILALNWATLIAAMSLTNNPLFKRQNTSTHDTAFKMYAYGIDIPGLEVIYGDGLAYLVANGSSVPSTISRHMSVTFGPTISSSGTWEVQQDGTATGSPPSRASLYIDPTTGSIEPVGFADSATHTLPDKAVTTGMGFFGSSMAYSDPTTGKVTAQFWAKMMEKDRLWVLIWNTDGKYQANCVPARCWTGRPPS